VNEAIFSVSFLLPSDSLQVNTSEMWTKLFSP